MVGARAPAHTKRRKMAFFEGCPVGWGGVPTGAGLVDGGVDQGPWLQERVGGVVFLSFLTRTKRRKMAFFEGCPVGWGGYPPELAWWTGVSNAHKKKMAFFEGCPVGWGGSWPGGRGGRPRALVAGEGWGGVGAMAVPKKGCGLVDQGLIPGKGVREGGARARGGCKGFGSGGVGGRHGPQGRSKFRNVCRILQKEEKWRFLKDAL